MSAGLTRALARVVPRCLTQSFDSLGRAGLDGPDAPPVKVGKQGFELRVAERHEPVPDGRPGEAVLLQPLVSHHKAGAVPVEQLQRIRPLRAEHEDRPGEGLLAQFVLHQGRQPVVALAEVHRPGGDHDPHPVRREDHAETASARTIAAIRSAETPDSSRIVTDPMMISKLPDAGTASSGAGGATTIAANSISSSGAGNTSLP